MTLMSRFCLNLRLQSWIRWRQRLEIDCSRPPDLSHLSGLGEIQHVNDDASKLRVTVDHLHRAVPAILAALKEQEVELSNLATHQATLEDVFVYLTGRRLRDE